ncbi:hypothetical protein FIBSPDRAFT_955539 [Athelia psychrophila]|uniref:Uncharacterized protein n=1 Tax=Athelia psychrophila TaxID=1759441 RepID=A0A166HTQ4_9AGAM|nr:hypothetical protein FIBSPDRAFT_955539 [Fibularhizoctonia sp. CBS 109695]
MTSRPTVRAPTGPSRGPDPPPTGPDPPTGPTDRVLPTSTDYFTLTVDLLRSPDSLSDSSLYGHIPASLSPDHVDTRLAIRTGGAPLQRPPLHPTSTLTAWVVNRESQRVERYFHSDRHLDGASPLETLSFPEAAASEDWTVKKALENHQRHACLVRYEIECTHSIHRIIEARIFNHDIQRQYFTLYTDLLDLRLEIQRVADSIRFLPSHYRFIFIPSYQTVLLQDAQRRQDSAEE